MWPGADLEPTNKQKPDDQAAVGTEERKGKAKDFPTGQASVLETDHGLPGLPLARLEDWTTGRPWTCRKTNQGTEWRSAAVFGVGVRAPCHGQLGDSSACQGREAATRGPRLLLGTGWAGVHAAG